jgi:hypothetical protein
VGAGLRGLYCVISRVSCSPSRFRQSQSLSVRYQIPHFTLLDATFIIVLLWCSSTNRALQDDSSLCLPLAQWFLDTYFILRSQGSSGSIVSDYELDDRAIGVRSPAEVKDFSSNLSVQNGTEAHPASCTMGTGGPLPGAKRGLTPSSAEVEWGGAIPPLPPSATMACSGTALIYFILPMLRTGCAV